MIIFGQIIPFKSEKEPVPKRVGTAAAFNGVFTMMPCDDDDDDEAAPLNSCFNSFTKWSFSMWGYLTKHKLNKTRITHHNNVWKELLYAIIADDDWRVKCKK